MTPRLGCLRMGRDRSEHRYATERGQQQRAQRRQRQSCDSHYNDHSTMQLTDTDERLALLRTWLTSELRLAVERLEPASADASFRRYFRCWSPDGQTRVVMDAPPDKEDVGPFLQVAALLERCGVHVPHIEAADGPAGWCCWRIWGPCRI